MIFQECGINTIFLHRWAYIIHDFHKFCIPICHTNAHPCRFQHLPVIHTVADRYRIRERNLQIFADLFHGSTLIELPVHDFTVHKSILILPLYAEVKVIRQKFLRLSQCLHRRTHKDNFISRLPLIFPHRQNVKGLFKLFPPAKKFTVSAFFLILPQKVLESTIRIGTFHTLHRPVHTVPLKNLHGRLSLPLRHRTIIDYFSPALDIAARAAHHTVKTILQQRHKHTIASPRAQ